MEQAKNSYEEHGPRSVKTLQALIETDEHFAPFDTQLVDRILKDDPADPFWQPGQGTTLFQHIPGGPNS